MRNSARSFVQFYEASFASLENNFQAQKLSRRIISDFVDSTPAKLDLLESYLEIGQFDQFYKLLGDLKYLIEFSNDIARYWYVLRGYSGALTKLEADKTVKGAKKIYNYYFDRYGDRRILRNEHWFEKKRWGFLDELQNIYNESELIVFRQKYRQVLAEDLKIYTSFMTLMINDLKKLIKTTKVFVNNKS